MTSLEVKHLTVTIWDEIGLKAMWRSLDGIFTVASEPKHCSVNTGYSIGIQHCSNNRNEKITEKLAYKLSNK